MWLSHLELLVVLLVGEPGPPALNVVSVDGFIDKTWQVLKGSFGVTVNRPAHQIGTFKSIANAWLASNKHQPYAMLVYHSMCGVIQLR